MIKRCNFSILSSAVFFYFNKQVVVALRYKTLQCVKGSLLTDVLLPGNSVQNIILGVSTAR